MNAATLTNYAAVFDYSAIAGGIWLAYLRWRFGPFKAHAIWLWRWHLRRRRDQHRRKMRPVIAERTRRRKHAEEWEAVYAQARADYDRMRATMPPGAVWCTTDMGYWQP